MGTFFAALMAFFALGTFGFWALLFLAIVIATAFEENENGISALFSLLVFAAIVRVLKPIILAVAHHPLYALLCIVGYFAVGTGWGVIKWTLFVRRQFEKFNEYKDEYVAIRAERAKNLGTEKATINDDGFQNDLRMRSIEFNPLVRKHKEDILRWMTFWPLSFLWTLISDPITKAFRHIYCAIQKELQTISDRVFSEADLKADLKLPELPPEALAKGRRFFS